MDHRSLLAQLTPEERARLTARSDTAGLLHLAGHLGALAVTGTLIALRVPYWGLVMLPHGVLLVFLFTLLHETVHDTPFRSRWLNRAVGYLAGVLLFLPPLWFRYFHFAHHRFTQIPGKDPELDSPRPATRRAWLCHVSGLPIWAAHLRTLARNARGTARDRYVPAHRHGAITLESRLMLIGYSAFFILCASIGTMLPLTLWLIPALLGQPVLRLYLLAEHGRCACVANMLENTRTTYTTRFVRWLAWNMPYHAEHHSLPTVPFHQLPALHAHMADHLKVTEQGYTRFTRSDWQTLA